MPDNRDASWQLGHHAEGSGRKQTTPSPSLAYAVGAGSDPGKRRKHNEDSIDSEIEEVIRSAPTDPSQVASALIQTALGVGGWDNISVIVVLMLEAGDQTLVPGVQLFARPESIHLPQA